jgi:hypothetical protein
LGIAAMFTEATSKPGMWQRRRLLQVLVAGSAARLFVHTDIAHAQSSAVKVTREEPVITRQEFDPRRPPRNMPKLLPPESGVCDTTFQLRIGVGYSIEAMRPSIVQLWVDELEISTHLQINIFTMAGAPAKLRAHEEGHREISEHYYRNAEDAVRAAARPLIGRMFTGEGVDRKSAEQDAMRQITTALEEGYMTGTRIRSMAANERYDEITEHGLDSIDEAEAIAMALDGDP